MVVLNYDTLDPNNYGVAFVEELFSRQLQALHITSALSNGHVR